MGDSAYKAILAGFSAHHHSLDRWLQLWTWWVIVGVACELAFIIWDHIGEYREWFEGYTRGVVPFPSKPKRLKLIFEMASVALVVFGVIGELRVEAKLGDLETNIQKTNEDRASHLQQEADSAETAAGKAQSSADTANASAKTAGQIANELLEDAKWRVLNPKFAEYLKGKPTGTFRVQFSAEDKDETFHLAQQFCIAFIYAGWKYPPPSDLHVDCPSSIPLKHLSRQDPNMPQSAVLPGKELRVLRGSQLSDSSGAALRVLHTAMGFALKGRKKTDFSWAGGEILEDVERGGIILLVEPRQHRVIENNNAKPK
jgi:hypothetical protein